MFDRTVVVADHRPSHSSVRVDHHEHRAPTDHSVALLKEMEKAATDKVEEAIRIEGNSFNVVVHMYRSMMDKTVHLKSVFDLNGSRQVVTYIGSEFDKAETHVVGLRDEIAKHIANEMIESSMDSIRKVFHV